MHISDIEIDNFRGLKHLLIEDLKTVNLFLGKNNVGKTSILEAVFISLAPNNPSITITIDNIRNLVYNQADDFRNTFYMFDYDNVTRIRTKYHLNDLQKELTIRPKSSSSVPLLSQTELGANFGLNTVSKGLINGLIFRYTYKKRHSKEETYVSSVELDNNAFKPIAASYKETTKAIIVASSTVHTSIGARYGKIVEAKKESEIIEFLRLIDSSIQGMQLGPNNTLLIDTGFERRYPINLLGEGVIKLLSILLAIYDSDGGIVLVDEINNGLHFTALRSLWKSIFFACSKYNVQLFASTHDYETLKHLKYILEEDDYKKFQQEVRAYTIRKIADNTLKSYLYDFEKLEAAIDQELEIR